MSYSSLRALAATFEIDVDALERELYAMKQASEDFVEIPRWVRLWTSAWWYNSPRPSRRQALIAEAVCMGAGLLFLAVSFLVSAAPLATMFRVGAGFQLVCGYLISLSVRIVDTYELWPATEISAWDWKPVRTLLGTIFDYTFVVAVLAAFFGILFWVSG